ncbi:MAG: RsmE family RNA methyltransferase [bacterium]|nr:RsmE family RNA methyltransferase [bacterium]
MNSAFYQEKVENTLLVKDKEEFHHLVKVRRVRKGEIIRLIDGKGNEFIARVDEINLRGRVLKATILEHHLKKHELPFKITLAFSPLADGKANDYLIEKCTELGVNGFVPVLFERSVKKRFRLERWSRIAREAVKQSNRSTVPTIVEPISFPELLKIEGFQHKFFGYLEGNPLDCETSILGDTLIVIGPEGDLTSKEVEALLKAGFTGFRFGETVLKAETAAVALATLIIFRMGGTIKIKRR